MAQTDRIAAIALAAAVLLAGCGAGVDGPTTAAGTDQPETAGPSAGETGTLSFYVSDQPNAIGDFENLTVTITEIGVHRAAAGGDGEDGDDPQTTSTEENTTDGENATTTNGTTTTTVESTTAVEPSPGDGENGSDAGWITHAVDDETVDLTELQGDNATKIADVSLPAAEYNGVYLAVSNVSGTLATGETVDVKLPSERLRLHKGFALGANNTTSFVFDIAVHETGNGRYILRPVVGQSGPDVPIRAAGSGGPPQAGNQSQQGAQAGGGPQQGNSGNASGNGGPQANARDGGSQGRKGGNASAAGRQPTNGTAA